MIVLQKPAYTKESFRELTDLWLKTGWELRYPYSFSWLGFPILQIPEDMIRMQEQIVRLKPDVIVETGVAHGGSIVFYASLLQLMGHGEVIGIEKGLRCREKVMASPVAKRITLVEGDSVSPQIVRQVGAWCAGKRALVILDSNHSKQHVLAELEAYSPLVSEGMYIVATDGNMRELADVPRGNPDWTWDNPAAAIEAFVDVHPEFVVEEPAWPFNESALDERVTYWPNAWLRRI
jgi:cephalosporin hydroxylase